MEELIDLKAYPVNAVLSRLLQDKSTKKNIIFATSEYGEKETDQITEGTLLGFGSYEIQPRVRKSLEQQSERTRKKAEVFTPSWLCNKMNNQCDLEWFGRRDVFNIENEQGWTTIPEKIQFEGKTWQQYVKSKRLEITCGEAPYIVSRYDTSTGELIPIKERIGFLDRKLRVVNENTENEAEWLKWTYKAFQSVYGFEFQGDNLLIARINLLVTFTDYLSDRWNRDATKEELRKVANIICWNVWQMDGITGTIPFGRPVERYDQLSIFDLYLPEENNTSAEDAVECRIYDWSANRSIPYSSLKERRYDEV